MTPGEFRKTFKQDPNLARRIGAWWILVGSLGLVFVAVLATAHYGYGVEVHDQDTGKLAAPQKIRETLMLLGGGFALFLAMGLALRRYFAPRQIG